MKNLIFIFLMTIVLSSCQQQQKIGFVDNAKVINEYQKKKDIEERYKQKDDAFKKKTDSISQAFQLEAKDFQLKSANMSQKKAQEQYQVLGQKQQFLTQQLQYEQEQIQKEFQTEIDSLISRVRDFVKDYGKTNGYAYILGSNEAGSVMYGSEGNDLSQVILDALNADYKKQ